MHTAAFLAVDVGAGQSGPVGLLVVVVLCLVAVLLFRSLNKQLRRVPRSFDDSSTGRALAEPPPADRAAPARPITPPDDPAGA